MRVLLFTILVGCFSISALAVSRADTLLHQLSIEEKVAMLFVRIPSNDKADSIMVGNTRFDSYCAYDTRNGISDSLVLPFPNEETLRTICDSGLIMELLLEAKYHQEAVSYDGLITFDPLPHVARLYVDDKAIQHDKYIQIIDFPCELLDELISNSNDLSTVDAGNELLYSGLPSLKIWEDSIDPIIDFDELLEQNILFWENTTDGCYDKMIEALQNGKVEQAKLNKRIVKLLNHNIELNSDSIIKVDALEQLRLRQQAFQKSIFIYQKEPVFPIERVDTLSLSIIDGTVGNADAFIEKAKYYQPSVSINDSNAYVQVFLCDDKSTLINQIEALHDKKDEANQLNALVFVGPLDNGLMKDAAKVFDALIVMPQKIQASMNLLAEALYGGESVSGRSHRHKELTRIGFQRVVTSKSRLGFNALTSGFNTDSIAKIDSIVNDAIKRKATPGAQLLVVKGGDIVLQRSYGYHTYEKRQKVENEDLYDVASITKLAVTFPIVMQLYEQHLLNLDAELCEYLTELDTTDKADITIRDLLVHQSGLVSYIPFHYKALDRETLRKRSLYSRHYSRLYNIRVDTRLYQNKNARFRKDVFSPKSDSVFNRQLTNNLYMNESYVDSMYSYIYSSPINDSKRYRYSDLGYYILQRIIEQEEKAGLDSIYYKRLSHSLGADKLLYKPLNNFSTKQIVPTENDLGFRKKMLDGYVHDQGAAMLGGVAAHAGLFANAGDLAKLAQMLLNEGSYGGIQYVNPNTIGSFTKTVNHGNRRGLGVDKPELEPDENSHVSIKASPASYGHTGFTGTILWIDPETDIIYIFLSNRIHPRSYNKELITLNVRTKIQDVIYNSLSE